MFTIVSTDRLHRLETLILSIAQRIKHMSAALDRLTSDVGTLRTQLSNLITLTNSIADQLRNTPASDDRRAHCSSKRPPPT